MALQKHGRYQYGDSQADIREEITRYGKANQYLAHHFADSVCRCGGKTFRLLLDDDEGAAVRICETCSDEHPIGDSEEYLAEAELGECACPCGGERFEITVGISLYDGSDDVRWLYLGCRCPNCAMVAVYGDWKIEFEGYQRLLARV
jgi:hypothetical protein